MHKLGVVQGLKLLPETAFRSEDCCSQHQRARGPALVLKVNCHVVRT